MNTGMAAALRRNTLVLMEASVVEALRRNAGIPLHPLLEHALLIYDDAGKSALSSLYTAYINIAKKARLPILVCTPTWRTNYSRLEETRFARDINNDAVRFLQTLRTNLQDEYTDTSGVFIGGLIGCKNDCYNAGEALSTDEAADFHSWQVSRLADSGVDFLFAATLPSLPEATGVALAMQATNTPYIISFVINSNGVILDGASLEKAFREIDRSTDTNPPHGYMINCSHPSFLNLANQPEYVRARLIGFQANASSKSHAELENSDVLHADDINDWGDMMAALNAGGDGIKILGGCCGTSAKHLEYIVRKVKPLPGQAELRPTRYTCSNPRPL